MPHNLPLAARCASSPEVKVSDKLKIEIQKALIARTQEMKSDLRARIAAGEALGQIGDPRFERRSGPHSVYLLPPMVQIPGGTYPIGDDQSKHPFEKPAHNVPLNSFEIGQFPVTNAEYKLFIDAKGYEDEQWWDTEESRAWLRGEASTEGQKEGWRITRSRYIGKSDDEVRKIAKGFGIVAQEDIEFRIEIRDMEDKQFEKMIDEWFPAGTRYRLPRFWDDTRFNNPSQPVVGVTWFEALAYCNWLTANIGSDKIYRLLTEVEFEAAARGQTARMFPYGKEFDKNRSNTFESHIRRTTPIGIFDNSTPEGAFDLSGNAYTWTLSIYDQEKFPYPYQRNDGREDIHQTGVRRVLRGGSWFSYRGGARAVSRYNRYPSVRLNSFGFRVVLSVRPPS
jgi:formylglycine-generating enzyme required for sulfatase activity